METRKQYNPPTIRVTLAMVIQVKEAVKLNDPGAKKIASSVTPPAVRTSSASKAITVAVDAATASTALGVEGGKEPSSQQRPNTTKHRQTNVMADERRKMRVAIRSHGACLPWDALVLGRTDERVATRVATR